MPKGQIPWNKGKKLSPLSAEHKKKISLGMKRSNHVYPCYIPSDETKQKLSEALKGRKKTKEHLQKISEALTGKKLSEEHVKNISKTMFKKGNEPWNKGVKNPWVSNGMIHPMKGKHPEAWNKGIPCRESTKKKLRKARLTFDIPKSETKIEIKLQEALTKRGLTFETHLPVCGICKPDIVFPDARIAVFADGDYWHSKEFKDGLVWRRDRNQDCVLKANGWIPLRFWGHEIHENAENCVDEITLNLNGQTCQTR